MKKKLTISVADIINKVNSPKTASSTPHNHIRKQSILTSAHNTHYAHTPHHAYTPHHHAQHHVVYKQQPLIIDQPMRFEELYRKVMKDKSNGTCDSSVKVVYQSKKVTPVQTNRVKRASVVSIHNTKPNNHSKCNSISSNAMNSVANSANKSNRPTTPTGNRNRKPSKQSILPSAFPILPSSFPIPSCIHSLPLSAPIPKLNIQQQINKLNHQQHQHIRQRNQCFLTQRQIDTVMSNMGYNIYGNYYVEFLKILQVDIYGGTPSENFIMLIQVIQQYGQPNANDKDKDKGKDKDNEKEIKIAQLPKIVNNNLQLKLDENTKILIGKHFSSFRINAELVSHQKENKHNLSNNLPQKQALTFQNILKQKNTNVQQFDYSSPKKITNTIISDLIQALAQSDGKNRSHDKCQSNQKSYEKTKLLLQASNKPMKPYLEQTLQKQQQLLKISQHQLSHSYENEQEQEEISTFRKVEQPSLNNSNIDEYNFSQELSGDKGSLFSDKQDSNITELKSRLNQALKKSSWDLENHGIEYQECPGYLQSGKYSKKPILSVDVNLGEGVSQKIIVFQGETAKQVSDRLANKFTISLDTKLKFQKMLQTHLNTMLWKIDQLSQEMLTDRDPE